MSTHPLWSPATALGARRFGSIPAAETYRPDIDGLRALSVIGVLLFHLKFHQVLGGFLGVDVFFVISGYLIGRQIIVSIAADQFSFGEFYEKRVRRIIPAILLVILFTHAFAFLLFTTTDYTDYSKSQIAQAFFVSNFYFMFTSGYFAQLDELKPILHTWTLSIEEQFYVAAPLLLLVLRNRRAQIVAVSAVTIGSLTLYLAWNFDPRVAHDMPFYNTLSRIWQIGAGTLLAFASLHEHRLWNARPWVITTTRLGCIAVLALSFMLGRSQGAGIAPWTVAATLAACGLVYLKPAHRDLFAHPVLVFIGKISFGLYLWHWPIIVFMTVLFPDSIRIVQVTTFAGALVAACLSYWLLETPIRRRRVLASRRSLFATCFIGLAGLTLISAAAVAGGGWPARIPPALAAAYTGVEDRNPRWQECFTPADWQSANIARIAADRPCRMGPRAGEPRFALIGDSHANAIMPAFDMLAARAGVPGVAMTYSGCPPLLGVEHVYETGRECARFNQTAIDYIRRHHIGTVYLVGFWDHYLRAHEWNGVHTDLQPTPIIRAANGTTPANTAELEAVFERALTRTLAELRDVKVYIVGQVPQQTISVPQGLIQAKLLHQPIDRFRVPRDVALRRAVSRGIFARHLQPNKVEFLDTIAQICREQMCAITNGDRPLYYDDNHLSAFGARTLEPMLAPTLPRAPRP